MKSRERVRRVERERAREREREKGVGERERARARPRGSASEVDAAAALRQVKTLLRLTATPSAAAELNVYVKTLLRVVTLKAIFRRYQGSIKAL